MNNKYKYQARAVTATYNFFSNSKNKNANGLIVVPMGGGKTWLAFQAVEKLFEEKILKNNEKVLWVVHRTDLVNQSKKDSKDAVKKLELNQNYIDNIIFKTVDAGKKELVNSNSIKLIIIDEAHHAVAKTYEGFFDNKKMLMGLTATPNRTDNQPLDFKQIYQVSFSYLINQGVLIKPKIIKKSTSFAPVEDFDNIDFNEEQRNKTIAEEFVRNSEKYTKSILYVHSNEHVEKLHKVIEEINKVNGNKYDYVDFYHAKRFNKKDRESFLKKFKNQKKGILVTNPQILGEGFNDPSVKTVSMCVPTKSPVLYTQAIGRALRMSKDQEYANIVEFNDDLPNAPYLMNSGNLFANINLFLEPEIISISFDGKEDLRSELIKQVGFNKKTIDNFLEGDVDNIELKNILLWNGTKSLDDKKWQNIIVHDEIESNQLSNFYNDISSRYDKHFMEIGNTKSFFSSIDNDFLKSFQLNDKNRQETFLFACKYAFQEKNKKPKKRFYIKYYTFQKNSKTLNTPQFDLKTYVLIIVGVLMLIGIMMIFYMNFN